MDREIEAATSVAVPFADACGQLREDPRAVLPSTIVVPVGAGTAVEQVVLIEIGRLQEETTAAGMAVSWVPDGHEKLLPSFTGRLVLVAESLSGTRVSLHGTYTVPLGAVGRFGDSLVGRRIARASISDLVERTAQALEDGHRTGPGPADRPTSSYKVDLHERGPVAANGASSDHFTA